MSTAKIAKEHNKLKSYSKTWHDCRKKNKVNKVKMGEPSGTPKVKTRHGKKGYFYMMYVLFLEGVFSLLFFHFYFILLHRK